MTIDEARPRRERQTPREVGSERAAPAAPRATPWPVHRALLDDGAPPVARPAAILDAATNTCAALADLPEVLHQLDDAGLQRAMSVTVQLRIRAEQLATLVAAEAKRRGTIADSPSASTAQWIAAASSDVGATMDPRDTYTIAAVADHCAAADETDAVSAALGSGSCTAAAARAALQQTDRVEPIIPSAGHDEVLRWFLDLDPTLGVRGQRQLTRRILSEFSPDQLDKQDSTLERTESLTFSNTETGMTRMVAELAPVNAAIVRGALLSLSAPKPRFDEPSAGSCTTGAATGHRDRDRDRDERTAGKRRVDALVALVQTATRLDDRDAVRLGPAARLVVTMPLETLSTATGVAVTPAGDDMDAGAARRLACDSEIVPAVLGTASAPLDVGRSKRLVTGGLRTAVLLRDKGCTFPGCDRPPQFCEVHHVQPWWAGGVTSLGNSATLCGAHHQTVHRSGLTATVDDSGVTWRTRPDPLGLDGSPDGGSDRGSRSA